MASKAAIRALFDAHGEKWSPILKAAFLESIADIRSAAQIAAIEDALRRGDIEGAIRATHLGNEFFAPLDQAMTQAFWDGGKDATRLLPRVEDPSGMKLIMRFDGRNPRAERYLRTRSSTLVTAIVEDQRLAIREAARAGMEQGANPTKTALNIVGRVDRATGKREGGILGLTSAQARYVANARAQLQSGNPVEMAAYLNRVRRDKRFDRTVMKAIREGKPVSAVDIEKMIARYEASLLKLRGDMIARTESLTSMGAAQYESALQMVDSGAVSADQIKKVWHSAGDGRVRDSHNHLNGAEVGLREMFVSSATGAQMAYPGDVAHGAFAEDVVACRCWMEIRVDHLAGFGRAA